MEELNPEVVGIVGARQAEGEAATGAEVGGEAFLVHGVDVERRIGEHEVEPARGVVRVFVVGDGFADVAFEAVDGEVHPAEPCGLADFLVAVDGEFGGWVFLVPGHEARGRDEHAARAARGIENAPVEGLKILDDEPDDRGGRVELAAFLTFRAGELAEKVFVDASEGVVVDAAGISETFLSNSLSSVLEKT